MKKTYSFLFAAMLFLFAAVQQVRAYDIPYRFYIPAVQGFASESGCAMLWHSSESETNQIALLTADPDASNWFIATVSLDDSDNSSVYFTLLNASTAEAATQSLAYEYESYGGYFVVGKNTDGSFRLYSTYDYCSQYPNDILPFNLQAHQGQDTLYVSWESNSSSSWRVFVYDMDGAQIASNYTSENEGYVILSNGEPMQIRWSVCNSNVYYCDTKDAFTAYSEPMTVQPSPKLATNIQAVLNDDGSYTFSWDAAQSPDVKQYWLNVQDPSGSSVYSCSNYIRTTSLTASFNALFSGTYSIHIYSYGENTWSNMGEATGTFEIAPVAAHDITVRFMVGPMSGIDTSEGLQFDIMKTAGNQEVVDASSEPYGWWSYTFNTNERGARVGVRIGYWTNMIDIYGDTCIEYSQYSGYRAAECDARATDYQPHDILAAQNEDGTYTISWLMDATERASYYNVYMVNAMNGLTILDLDKVTATQANTSALEAGMYYLQITVNEQIPTEWGGYDVYQIGYATTYITVEEQPAHDITVRVLPQPGAGEWYAFTYNSEEYEYSTPVEFVQETGSPWFTYTVNTTSPAVSIMFMSASDIGTRYTFSCTENTCIELEDGFKLTDCNTALKNYSVSNAQREDLGNGKMKFSWECEADPASFAIYLNDADNNPFKVLKADGADRNWTEYVLVDSAMATVNWYVLPVTKNNTYLWDLKADGASFSLEASPYVPKNITATPNSDGSWHITWDPCPEPVYQYTVNCSADGYTMWTSDPYFNTSVISSVGTYSVTVTALMSGGETGGSKSATFTVEPVPARDITVRMLIHPDANNTYAGDLYLQDTYTYISPIDEGNGWYSYTFNSDLPAANIYLKGAQYNVGKDTCFEYYNYLNYASCDAEPHDYRIADGSLNAVSQPGRVTFSWAPVAEKATYYYLILEYYNDENGYWTSFLYQQVADTCYTYIVPDEYDGREISWSVYPTSPHDLYNNRLYGENITLQKSLIELSDFQLSTTDSVHYHFSWASNTDTVQYQFEMSQGYYGNPLYSVIQPGKTVDYTFISGTNTYNCRVRAVNAAGEPLSGWLDYTDSEGSRFFSVKSSLRCISDLQGAVSGNTLNYTWMKTVDKVFAYLECETADMGYFTIFSDSILTGNSLSVDVTRDGRYRLYLTPAIEYMPGKYTSLYENHECWLHYFTEPTFHIAVSTTTGGILMDDYSGDYPAGYTLYLRVMADNGYRFIGWSDGNTDRRRVLVVEEAANLIALFEPVPSYNVTLAASDGGKIMVDYSGEEVSLYNKTLYATTLYVETRAQDGFAFYGWSDGYDKTQLNRYINISQDTAVTAIFKPICYVTTSAGVGGRVQVTGAQYDKTTKRYSCSYGSGISLKANPDEGYRFTAWSDGNTNVTRTLTVTGNISLSASFESVETPLAKYTVRVLSADLELGSVNQINGTYSEGDKVTVCATPAVNANFVQWSDGNTEATRVITVNADITLTASFAIKHLTLSIAAGQGGSVNTDVNGTYEYGAQVILNAVPEAGYQFVSWSDGYQSASRTVDMIEDITLTATFAQEQYLITFLNADGALIETNRYSYGRMPECSVTPTLAPTEEWIYTFTGWSPALAAVTGNAVYTAQYSQAPNPHTGFESVGTAEKATKVLVNGQIFILRGERIYTIQGQLVK